MSRKLIKSDDSENTLGMGPVKIYKKNISQLYEFYISGTIEPPEQYTEVFDIIRHCTPNDTVKIYINSGGGDLFTAIQFMRVLSETEATVVCSVEGICASAATIIFLCADQYELTNHSSFLFHNYSSGVYGKGGEQYDQIIHERKWSDALLHEIYEGFLTQDEITSLLSNKDIWLSTDEVAIRMKARALAMQELLELEEATKPEKEQDE